MSLSVSLSLGSASLAGGTLRGKGREVRRSLANIFEIEEEVEDEEGSEKQRHGPEEPAVGVKQLSRLLEQQLAGAERQDGFSYFAGDKPKLEERKGEEEQPGPSHRDASNSPHPTNKTESSTTCLESRNSDYEDLLRSLTPESQVTTRRRRRSSASPGFPTPTPGPVQHSLDEFLGQTQDAVPALLLTGPEGEVENAEAVELVDDTADYSYDEDIFRVSTVSTVSSVSDDEYVLFKAHDEDEEDEEW